MRAHPLNYNSIHAEKKAFPLPPLPSEEWCDFRKDYESGMTMKAIADKYICDPRTVKKCLLQNKSSKELGRQTAPTKLAPYLSTIDRLFQEYALTTSRFCTVSRSITQQLTELGYTGSERTVRNYLQSKYQIKAQL